MRALVAAFALVAPAAILAQTADHPLNVGGEVKPPTAIYTVNPESTEAMIKERTSCAVVGLIVDEQGTPHDPHLIHSSGSSGLDQNTLRATAGYRFKPATLKGTPVAVTLNIETCIN
jgi:periplasmic protein TonB